MIWSLDRTNFDRNIAVVIGIDNYQNGIHQLKTAVNDARAIADLLEQEYEYQEVIRLFPDHGEATLAEINKLLFETLPNKIQPTEGDRLIFYFAGHGVATNSQDGPEGFILPQDAKLDNRENFFPMRDLIKALSELDCHHLLVILDCCFAGSLRWSSTRNVIPVPEKIHREHHDRFIRCRAWQSITSAAHNQEALDFVSDLREGSNNPHHSPFALALIEGLKNSKADLTRDGVITAPELYLYLRDCLISKDGYSELQTPGLWPLQKHDRGEFIFTLPGFEREQLKPAPPLDENNNPYRGLQPYDEKHARFFFGRQELIEELYKKISPPDKPSNQLIAVLGISGSGKSSLVKAGLIPYLRKNHVKEWQILEPMRPGKSPFIALASTISAIANVSSDAINKYIKQLVLILKKGESQPLIDIIKAWSQANSQIQLLLTIDQLEELITMSRQAIFANSEPESNSMNQKPQDWFSQVLCRHSKAKNNNRPEQKEEVQQEWQHFLVLLIDALKNCPQLHIVLTLRSDFEARFVESALKEYWDKARFPVRPMRSDELREAIEKPASERALYFDPAKGVDRLIDEVGEMPGALPLLSFTLSEFYIKLHQAWVKDGKTDRALTVDEQFYQQGGIGGSLTYRANEIYESLPDNAHRDTMRRVMLRMVEIQGGEAVRRQVPESELVYTDGKENQRVNKVIKSLVDARLVVTGKETGEPYYEPAHDFLVRGWTKLQEWQEQTQKTLSIEVQRRLTQAANDWSSTNQKREQQGLLWNDDPRLVWFEPMLPANALSPYKRDGKFRRLVRQVGKTFYRVLQPQKETAGEPNQLNQRELEFVLKSVNFRHERLGQIVSFFIIVMGVVSGLGGLAWILRGQAVSNEINAIARQLAAQAGITYHQQVFLLRRSLLLAVESMRRSPSTEAAQALQQGIALLPRPVTSIPFDKTVKKVVFSANEKYFATISSNRQIIHVREIATGKDVAQLQTKTPVNEIALSPNGTQLAIVDDTQHQNVVVWDVTLQKNVAILPQKRRVDAIIFSPDGSRLYLSKKEVKNYKPYESITWVWEAFTNTTIPIPTGIILLAFSPNGKWAVKTDDGVQIWNNLSNPKEKVRLPDLWRDKIRSISFSPDGKFFAFISVGPYDDIVMAQVFDISYNNRWNNIAQETVRLIYSSIGNITVSSGGKYIAATIRDYDRYSKGEVKLWQVQSHREKIRIPRGDIKAVSANGHFFARYDAPHLSVRDTATGKLVSPLLKIPKARQIKAIALSPDGQYLAAVTSQSDQYTIMKWEVRSGREEMNIPIRDIQAMDEQYFKVAFADQQQIYLTTKNVTEHKNGKEGQNLKQIEFKTLEVTSKRLLPPIVIQTQDDVRDSKVALSINGGYLAIAKATQITVWKTTTGQIVNQFIMPKNISAITKLTVSPEGNYVATVDLLQRSRMRIWQLSTGREISRFQAGSHIWEILFSQKYLFTEEFFDSDDPYPHNLGVWLWQPQDLIDEACHHLSRNLTQYEWQQYLGTEPYRQTCPGLPTPDDAEDESSQASVWIGQQS
jgi:WD40 repeat protein